MGERKIVLGRYAFILHGILILTGLYLISLSNYLLFHTLVEMFSIVVACGIFIIAWNSRQLHENSYLLFIGIAYLCTGIIDLFHTLSYKGVGVFPGYDTNLPTQLWIAARYIESLSLLAAPFFLRHKPRAAPIFIAYAVITTILLASVFWWGAFPNCYIEGQGLTPFKKVSEYVVSILLGLSIVHLWRKRHEDRSHLWTCIKKKTQAVL